MHEARSIKCFRPPGTPTLIADVVQPPKYAEMGMSKQRTSRTAHVQVCAASVFSARVHESPVDRWPWYEAPPPRANIWADPSFIYV